VISGPLSGAGVWRRADLAPESWRLAIPEECRGELDRLIKTLRAHPLETRLLDPADYDLGLCRRFMARVKAELDQGAGFAVLDRLPVAAYSKDELTAIYWLLSTMIARPVAQSFDGRVLYDVRDIGVRIDTRVRGDLTRQELSWHTDYGFNLAPPYIGLLVLRTAREGGVSSVASMLTAHNELARHHPDLLARLYQPFYWNRQGEHPEGDRLTHFYPVFRAERGAVQAQFIKWLLYKGYELEGVPFDALGQRAIETMFEIMSAPENHVTFTLEPGQIQYLNNARIAHCRSDYVDHDEPDQKRHLIRIFLRDGGRRSYMG
jgi:alpha-ketoglutarate-dependent taurine dioxygenase